MNTHSIMKCPVSKEDITIVSYPPYGSSWSGWAAGKSEIICCYKTNDFAPVCMKESGRVYTEGSLKDKNVCTMQTS